MVPTSIILSLFVSGLLEIAIPIALALYVAKRLGGRLGAFLIGGILFLVSLIRIPLNTVASAWIVANLSGQSLTLLTIAFPSLTAGIFEEGIRWVGLRFLVKDRKVEAGIMYGVGHGGFESIFYVGATVLSTAFAVWLYPQIVPPALMATIAALPVWEPLVGVYERIFAISFHIGMSVLVLHSIIEGKPIYLGAAMAAHFLLDFTSVYMIQFGIFVPEVVVTIFGAAALYYVLREGGKGRQEPSLTSAMPPPVTG